jgi:hypothetical protein
VIVLSAFVSSLDSPSLTALLIVTARNELNSRIVRKLEYYLLLVSYKKKFRLERKVSTTRSKSTNIKLVHEYSTSTVNQHIVCDGELTRKGNILIIFSK